MSEIKRPEKLRFKGNLGGLENPVLKLGGCGDGQVPFYEIGENLIDCAFVDAMPDKFEPIEEAEEPTKTYRMTATKFGSVLERYTELCALGRGHDFNLVDELEAACNPPKPATEPEPKPEYTEADMISFGDFTRGKGLYNSRYYLSQWKEARNG